MTRQELKEKTKQQLGKDLFGKKWLMMLVAILIADGIIAAATSIIPGIGGLALYGIVQIGLTIVLLEFVRNGKDVNISDLFKGFSDKFFDYFLLGFMESLFIALWSLLFVIPGIVKTYAYSMAFFIKHDNPDYTWSQCLKESQRMTNGKKGELFMLDLSFIGWYIVGSLCLGVGTLWVAAYHETAKANFYENLKAEEANGVI